MFVWPPPKSSYSSNTILLESTILKIIKYQPNTDKEAEAVKKKKFLKRQSEDPAQHLHLASQLRYRSVESKMILGHFYKNYQDDTIIFC